MGGIAVSLAFADQRPSCLPILALILSLVASASLGVRANGSQTSTAAQGVIVGRVVDATGAPVAGAGVKLYLSEQENWRWERYKSAGISVLSDQNGEFEFQNIRSGDIFPWYVIVAERAGFAPGFRGVSVENNHPRRIEVVLNSAVSPAIHVIDQAGNPVSGARVRCFHLRGKNGEFFFYPIMMQGLGVTIPLSDDAGQIKLPPLPIGDLITRMTVDHPNFAAARVDDLTVAKGARTYAVLRPGITLTLRAVAKNPADRISMADIDLRHKTIHGPAWIKGDTVNFDAEGVARLTVEPGDYWFLGLEHNDFYLTPRGESLSLRSSFRIEPGQNDDVQFDVRRKVKARGRLVDAVTGKPIPGEYLIGELANGLRQDLAETSARQWTVVVTYQAKTDKNGDYSMLLAEGLARVSLVAANLVTETEHFEFTVAADGTTVIPDLKARPIPKITGNVVRSDGSPAAKMVVCVRGKRFDTQPVLTDESGRFEVQPIYISTDPETGRRILDGRVIAFDPYRPLGAIEDVRIDRPKETVLKLEPHDADWPLAVFSDLFTDWERGLAPSDQEKATMPVSLRHRDLPELDGAMWLNTDGKALTFADLRGKYVLLDFWFSGCLPCRQDYPSVKLVHDLYKDKGLVVIGIHANRYETLDAVREYVSEKKMSFPVVVDFPDGRSIARYQKHGIALAYPSYVLLDPEGKVLLDDTTIPHPYLRGYKLEIIRKYIIGNSGKQP
jgi:thiol-disulfide isomerase/thioredoxin